MPKARQVLTSAAVAGLARPARGRIELFDALVPGFGIRVSANGHRSWILMYRFNAKQRRATLGSHPAVTLAQARQLAREIKRKAGQGLDPSETLAGRDPDGGENSFAVVAQMFIERHAKRKNRHWRETKRIFDVYVNPDKLGEHGRLAHAGWGRRAISGITGKDVAALLDHVETHHGPVMADRVLAAIRKMFFWCMEEGGNLTANPVFPGMSRTDERKRARRRWLAEDEIRGLWEAAETIGWPFGPFIEMLLVTGRRRGEVASMRWSDVENDLWTGPAHDVPLSSLASEILDRLPRLGDHVFTTNRRGDRPLAGFSRAKARCDEHFHTRDPWTMQDLRATVRNHMSELGIQRETIDQVLGKAGAAPARLGGPGETGHALEAWAGKIRSCLEREN